MKNNSDRQLILLDRQLKADEVEKNRFLLCGNYNNCLDEAIRCDAVSFSCSKCNIFCNKESNCDNSLYSKTNSGLSAINYQEEYSRNFFYRAKKRRLYS